jgi:hypothetical protein
MTNPGKVRASAGAEWLLGGFGLLKKAPLALGLVGLVFGIVSLLPLLVVNAGPALSLLAQLVVVVLTPIMLGGMVYAAREVDHDRAARPSQLLQPFREGKALAMVAQLLPQIAAGLVAMVLLVVMIGPSVLQDLVMAVEQSGGQDVDPAVFANFPLGAFALWMLLAVLVGVLAYTFTFLFPAQVMLEGTGPFAAMLRSFRACIANIGAFVVFIVLLLIVAIAIMVGAQIVGMALGIVLGEMAGAMAAQLLMMAVLMPVVVGAAYFAWRQLLGGGTAAGTTATPASGIEV